jgi:hypothetical protein
LVRLVSYHQEVGDNYNFTTRAGLPDGHFVEDDSDEEQYNYVLRRRTIFHSFEEAKEVYVLIALQLIKSHEELERCWLELDYLYKIIFQYDLFPKSYIYNKPEIDSKTIHLGLFYEIVLSDQSILVVLSLRK